MGLGRTGRLTTEQRQELSARWKAGETMVEIGRVLGLAVVRLGGGRTVPADSIDPAVGLSGLVQVGDAITAGQALALVHAWTPGAAAQAAEAVKFAFAVGDEPCARRPVVLEALAE